MCESEGQATDHAHTMAMGGALAWLLLCGAAMHMKGTAAVPTVPIKDDHQPEVDKRWFKKWRGERPGLEKGENHWHAPRPLDFDMEQAFKSLPVTEGMLAQWEREEDQAVASFAYTVALALGGVAGLPERSTPGFSSKVTVHAIGAGKAWRSPPPPPGRGGRRWK